MADCREMILSDEYVDFIGEERFGAGLFREGEVCRLPVDSRFSVYTVSREAAGELSVTNYPCRALPQLFTTMDTSALEASGILRSQISPVLGLTGRGVLIGLLDTGIDYTHSAFRDEEGRTRLAGIWDQTVQAGVKWVAMRVESRKQVSWFCFF